MYMDVVPSLNRSVYCFVVHKLSCHDNGETNCSVIRNNVDELYTVLLSIQLTLLLSCWHKQYLFPIMGNKRSFQRARILRRKGFRNVRTITAEALKAVFSDLEVGHVPEDRRYHGCLKQTYKATR